MVLTLTAVRERCLISSCLIGINWDPGSGLFRDHRIPRTPLFRKHNDTSRMMVLYFSGLV